MFCFSEQFLVLVLAHLLLAPFYNTSHTLTSLYIGITMAEAQVPP
jgi:hypothetical protein